MVRVCCVLGCRSTTGLHRFPGDPEIRRQWLRALELKHGDITSSSVVCNQHFTPDSFSNSIEFEMGFIKCLHLKSNAVPRVEQEWHNRTRRLQPKLTRKIRCKVEPVATTCDGVLASLRPARRSKASQEQAPTRGESCDPGTFTEPPFPESPSSTTVKIENCEVLVDESSYHPDGSEVTVKPTSSFDEVPPPSHKEYIVHEEQLLKLFWRCPVCSRRCFAKNNHWCAPPCQTAVQSL